MKIKLHRKGDEAITNIINAAKNQMEDTTWAHPKHISVFAIVRPQIFKYTCLYFIVGFFPRVAIFRWMKLKIIDENWYGLFSVLD